MIKKMKTIASLLTLICAGLFGWNYLQGMADEGISSQSGTNNPPKEVFPQTMKNISPWKLEKPSLEKVNEVTSTVVKEEKVESSEKQQDDNLEKPQDHSSADTTSLESKQPEKENQVSLNTDKQCWVMESFTSKQLPGVNKSLKSMNLLEKVEVQPTFSKDQYVVFIIPTTTKKGAEALLKQVRSKGYKDAEVITEGPLLNATRLGVFSTEERAQAFTEKARKTLKMNAIRVSRIMGKPTNRVNLVFNNLTEKETTYIQNLAKKLKKSASVCQ